MTERVHDVVYMPGDGIGVPCCEQTRRVLDAAGFQANYHFAPIGWAEWCKNGNPLPQETIDLLAKYKVGLFGAITSKPKKEAEAELNPALRGKCTYYSPIVSMRQHFNLETCVRPCISIPHNPLNFVRKGANGQMEEPPVRVVVFRQNTECLYCGVEWTNPPPKVMEALATHPKFKPFTQVPGADLAVSLRIATRGACQRIIRAAFEYAKKYDFKSVTICEKPNVVRETSGMMEEEAKKIAREYPNIALWSVNVDAQMMWMTKNPETLGIIVSSNMFGDIISDGFAGLIGGLGFGASANIGPDVAVFEPTHGSAPKYEHLKPQIVNPCATFLCAAMMLDHVGDVEKATLIRDAIAAVIADGKVKTYDMMRLTGGPQVLRQGAASTEALTDAVIAEIQRLKAVRLNLCSCPALANPGYLE